MKWAEMTSREKTERIVQDVMGWTYFATWDIMHTARWALENANPMAYPYAFWSDKQEGVFVFYHEYEDAYLFNPLGDMGDAWQAVEKLKVPDTDITWTNYSLFANLCGELEEVSDNGSIFAVLWGLTPERIRLAALKACRGEIE